MLTIATRILRDVTHDPTASRFSGRVDLTFREAPDDAPRRASLLVRVALPHRARFSHVEAALLDEAERRLRLRLAELDEGPANIFAPRRHVIVVPDRHAA